MKNKTIILILTTGALVLPNILKADTTHYKNILVGDRAANMAGAFIGLSDDSSGCYYNPAGISYTVGTNLSGSVNAYHIQHSKYDDAIRGYDWERKSAELLPNFFGVIKNHGKHSFGLSVVVPDSFVQHQDQEIDDLPASGGMEAIKRYTLNRHEEDSTTISGITYAYEFNPSLAVGTTLNYFHRKYRMGNNQTLMYEDDTFVGSFYNSSWGEKGIYPKIGVRWAPHEKVNFGLTISKIFIIESRWDSMSQIKERNSSDLVYSKNDSKVQRSTPFELGVGMALLPFSNTTFTFDVNLYTDPGINEFAPYGYDSVLNFSFAVEYAINKKNVVRLGYFTNNTAAPMPNDNTKGLEHIDMWGISTGYSIHNESTSFTVGVVYSKGAGTAQIYDNSSRIVNLNRYSLTGLLSTNYKL